MFSRSDIDTLLSHDGAPCVSIYLHTARAGPDTRRNAIELRNGLAEAQAQLHEQGIEKRTADAMLAPLESWRHDRALHRHLDEGMAIFLAPEYSQYLLAPESFDFHVAVDDAFQIRPLLPLLSRDGHFMVLALDRERVRLFAATRFGIREREADLPESWHAIRDLTDYEKQTGFHPTGPTPTTTGTPEAKRHAYGESPSEVREMETEAFVHSVAKAMEDITSEQPDTPLVLCADPRLAGHFREYYSGRGLVDEHIDANPAGLEDHEIHQRAYARVEPILRMARDREAARLAMLLEDGSGRASTRVDAVVSAASQGRVASLFVARDESRWGKFDRQRQAATCNRDRETGDVDLMDLAARETLRHGGAVFTPLAKAMPSGAVLAAAYRY